MTLSYAPPFMDLATLAEHICTGESTIENWVRMGIFPKPKKIGGKRLWEWKAVQKHLASPEPDGAALDLAERIRHATQAASRENQKGQLCRSDPGLPIKRQI